jgi:hypothetical protein
MFTLCAEDPARDELRARACWGSGVLDMVGDAVSELKRLCMDMRFLLAAGVFELYRSATPLTTCFWGSFTLF